MEITILDHDEQILKKIMPASSDDANVAPRRFERGQLSSLQGTLNPSIHEPAIHLSRSDFKQWAFWFDVQDVQAARVEAKAQEFQSPRGLVVQMSDDSSCPDTNITRLPHTLAPFRDCRSALLQTTNTFMALNRLLWLWWVYGRHSDGATK